MSASSPLEYVQDLYNGHSAIAERVSPAHIKGIHIETRLDDQLKQWAIERKDIILTGNPGDGKTHLINLLQAQGTFEQCHVERDASQRGANEILALWAQRKREGMPFILAVNHAPLRQLAREAAKSFPELSYLNAIPTIISAQVIYNEPVAAILPNTVVVDLSQRELITKDIVQALIQRLCALATAQPCTDCPPRRCPIEHNATMLSQPQVLENLMKLLRLVARRGFHATMRDLIGLLAYLLVGEVPCARRWQLTLDEAGRTISPQPEDYAYYTLLFRGRSKLFNAIRATFDPGTISDPSTDMPLWSGNVQQYEWLASGPLAQPATLTELRTLKRRYYFEHIHDTDRYLQRVLPVTDRRFLALLTNTEEDYRVQVEELLAMINAFYAPLQQPDKQREFRYQLHLWNSHRYAIGSAPGYVAMRFLSVDKFAIYRPQLTPTLDEAIDIHQDHILLGTRRWQTGDPALRVDWPMYQSLAAAQMGHPIDIQPFHILRRLDLFLRHLGQDAGGSREIETILMSDQRRRQVEHVRVNRRTHQYE